MAKKVKKFNLATIKKGLSQTSSDFLKEVQSELVQEEQQAFRDFIKGAYRLKLEKEKEIEALKKEVARIDGALNDANGGTWGSLSELKIPARFFDEKTLRKHGKSLISGSEEVRFVDLYVNEDVSEY